MAAGVFGQSAATCKSEETTFSNVYKSSVRLAELYIKTQHTGQSHDTSLMLSQQ